MQVTRQHVIDTLRKMGFPQVAEEASRVLPDPVDLDRVGVFCERHGIFHDDLISRLGPRLGQQAAFPPDWQRHLH